MSESNLHNSNKVKYFINNTIDKIEIKKENDSLFFYVKKEQSFLGKFTLSYFNSEDEIFFILKKYDYLFYFTRNIILNKLKYKPFFYKKKLTYIMAFDNKLIEFKTLDISGKRKEIYLNSIKIGIVKPIYVSQEFDEYVLIFDSNY